MNDTTNKELDKLIARLRLKPGTHGFFAMNGINLVGMTDAEAKQAINQLIQSQARQLAESWLPEKKPYVTTQEQSDAAVENYGRNCWNACQDEMRKRMEGK